MKTLIIDDEPQSHVVLKQHLAIHYPDVQVIGTAFSKEQGVRLVNQYHPDLLFLDIEMPDGTGFDLLREVDHLRFQVIFVTAHNQYAQTAIRFGALDYLLKPISASELSATILKAQVRRLEHIQLAQMDIMRDVLQKLQQKKLPPLMGISTAKGVLYFPTKSIIRLEAMQNFTEFMVDAEDRRLIASFNLKKFETDLKPFNEFMRVHRSHLVNLHKVARLIKGEKYYLEMSDSSIIPVSRKIVGELNLALDRLAV